MSEAIVVERVSKSFGPTRALADVSLSIERGESRALIGKNGAGKSTMMSILTGLVAPDSGSVRVLGDEAHSDFGAVGCVYQRSTLVPAATAAENISLNQYPTSRRLIRWREVRRRAVETLGEWGCEHVADVPVERLDPLERKIVEICRVLSSGPRVLLLDEPTAGLDRPAVQQLFANIASARARGVTVIFVSHHLHEVFEVCDSVTVLRDGRLVSTDRLDRLTVPDLVEAMVGESATQAAAEIKEHRAARHVDRTHPPVLVAEGLTAAPKVRGVGLDLRAGECVGLTGIDGAGHMQVAEILTGQRAPDAGRVTLDDKTVPLGSIRGCMAAGIGFTPEDRHISGYVPALSVAENATLGVMNRFTDRFHRIDFRKRNKAYQQLAQEWSIKAHGVWQATEELSGGNQQKVVLARSVASAPRVLVLVNPTAGVDVQAKNSIYSTIDGLKGQGQSVLVVTSDDGDLEICDRVLVMFQGEVVSELHPPFSETALATAVQGPADGAGHGADTPPLTGQGAQS
ncbi:MAG: multidrug transporter ATP-binding protein [Gemmatimonadales bacterium]|jgi:simple sugar transport system ATP-binding protein|nr:multidrug transporter ATP-binding protein [Gemmatimonadales bacterium]